MEENGKSMSKDNSQLNVQNETNIDSEIITKTQ